MAKKTEPASEWLTPTQISKEEGMPNHTVQLLYGYIRQGKLEAKRVEGTKGQLVDAEKARELLAAKGTRGGPRGPRPPRPKPEPIAQPGLVTSHEAEGGAKGGKPAGRRRVEVVTEVGRSSVITHDGQRDMQWKTDSFAKRLKDGTTHVESLPDLIAIVGFSLAMDGEKETGEDLVDWAEAHGLLGAQATFVKLLDHEPWGVTQEGEEEEPVVAGKEED